MYGEQGEQIMAQKLLDSVPKDAANSKHTTIAKCSDACGQAARSALAKFCSPTVQGSATTCAGIVKGLALKQPPVFASGKMNPMVQKFIDRLSWLSE